MRQVSNFSSINNILQEEEPTIIDLFCYEEVALSDEEEESQQVQQAYLVTVQCAHCLNLVTFNYWADLPAIRELQQRLFDCVHFVCESCAAELQ